MHRSRGQPQPVYNNWPGVKVALKEIKAPIEKCSIGRFIFNTLSKPENIVFLQRLALSHDFCCAVTCNINLDKRCKLKQRVPAFLEFEIVQCKPVTFCPPFPDRINKLRRGLNTLNQLNDHTIRRNWQKALRYSSSTANNSPD